ncbi:hypothetical protein GGR53DRAFT_505062 [Hypoxylon sp. FL1150]|nr:hypothetical protein GGR53DRAFT_505062 [Hypoxylon sp. FL1150]
MPRKRKASPATGATKRLKLAHGTSIYDSALAANHLTYVSEPRPDLQPLIERIKVPLKVGEPLTDGKDIVQSLHCFQFQLRVLANSLIRIQNKDMNEATLDTMLAKVIPTDAAAIEAFLQLIRNSNSTPEMQFLSSVTNLHVRRDIYCEFLCADILTTARPDSIVGTTQEWLVNFVEETVNNDFIALQVLENIWNKIQLCADADLIFPVVLMEEKVGQPLNKAIHQLGGVVAAALEANAHYLEDSNVIFGLAADTSMCRLYIAWREEAGNENKKPRYKLSPIMEVCWGLPDKVLELHFTLMRIYLWATRERMAAIEGELKNKVLREAEDLIRRRDAAIGLDTNQTATPATAPEKALRRVKTPKNSIEREARVHRWHWRLWQDAPGSKPFQAQSRATRGEWK